MCDRCTTKKATVKLHLVDKNVMYQFCSGCYAALLDVMYDEQGKAKEAYVVSKSS